MNNAVMAMETTFVAVLGRNARLPLYIEAYGSSPIDYRRRVERSVRLLYEKINERIVEFFGHSSGLISFLTGFFVLMTITPSAPRIP